jgi:NADH-quinone oxidoreductase subunit G
MTATATPSAGAPGPVRPAAPGAQPPDLVTLTIDDIEVSVPKGTLVIRAAEQLGIVVPRFCDHPLLPPAGACRQCLVEVATPAPDGSLRAMPKPQASCTLEATNGMVVRTQVSSPVAEKAQRGIMEFLLINHPLDCPVCDKGGECPLQNQAMAGGRTTSRFTEAKRTFPKPIQISTGVLLDRERCVLCQRCTRFAKVIAGDPFIDLQLRGAQQQIGTFSPQVLGYTGSGTTGEALLDEQGHPFASYFSGNTVQICPVGALTGAAYRFRARPFDLVSTPSVCEHCASGCALRVDHRRGTVTRRLAGDDPAVNEEWNCDKGRWAFTWATAGDRLTTPLIRDEDSGELRPASWPEAIERAATGLAAARDGGGVGVLTGGRITVEDAYAYAKFARVALGSNDIDFRARPHSAEEEAFLGQAVAGAGLGVTYADLEAARVVLLVGFEPEEESPIVFLRLRKAVRGGQRVFAVAPWATRGLEKLSGHLVPAVPGAEAETLTAISTAAEGGTASTAAEGGTASTAAEGGTASTAAEGGTASTAAEGGTASTAAEGGTAGTAAGEATVSAVAQALGEGGAVILVGERAATFPGTLTAVLRLAAVTGARVAWVPRRAGERGAAEAGALASLLPGGRPVADPEARVDVAAAWEVDALPGTPGRDTAGILAAAAAGELAGLVVGGVDPADLPDPQSAVQALEAVGFLVSLEVRASAVTELADVVLPVAPVAEKAGTFVDWEGRWRSFPAVLTSNALPDFRVLDALADALDFPLGLRGVEQVRGELGDLEAWEGIRVAAPEQAPATLPQTGPGEAVLATWHLLLDAGRLQDGEPYLAGTAHRAVVRLSAATAAGIGDGIGDGDAQTVGTAAGSLTLPAVVTEMPDGVVWLPTNSTGSPVRAALGVAAGAVVTVSPGAAAAADDVRES